MGQSLIMSDAPIVRNISMKNRLLCALFCSFIFILMNACGKNLASSDTGIALSDSIESPDTSVKGAEVTSDYKSEIEETSSETAESIGLSKEAVQALAKKRGMLSLEDIEQYVGQIVFDPQTGSVYKNYFFEYDGIPTCLRIVASDGSIASKPYSSCLDSAILFRQDFLDLDTEESELLYEGTCGDIRHGDITHILDGNITMDDYLACNLPDGYSLSDYKYWIGTHGGAYVIEGGNENNQTFENTGYSSEIQSLGGVEIATVSEPENNVEFVKTFDDVCFDDVTIISGLCELYRTNHTWYLAYTQKENSHISFCFYLNPEHFTEQQFLTMVKSIKFKSDAIY